MIHANFDPESHCQGRLKILRQLGGAYRRRVVDVWECQKCSQTNSPHVARRLRLVWRHLEESGRLDRTAYQQTAGVRQMKLRLSVSRKGGAPNYGSDGASAEIELTLDDELTIQQIADLSVTWYRTLEQAVERQLESMQAKHPGPREIEAPPAAPQPAAAAVAPYEPRRPAPRRPAPEPGWDDQPAPPPAPARNGSGRERDDPPRNGAQLLGWAYNHGQGDRLKALAKDVKDRGPIKEWDPGMVAWAYAELSRPQPAGQWGHG